ncbi:MAG: hypothetical protein K9K79_05320 [Desulfohalobiaceae bacterium]|nr:hypothetical protein [Desulfohalobiaceae bacterium]
MDGKSFLAGCLVTAGMFMIAGFAAGSSGSAKFQVDGDRGFFCILDTQSGDYRLVLPSGDPVSSIRNFSDQRKADGYRVPDTPKVPRQLD